MNSSGYQDVDYVLTTRELGRMIREAGLDFVSLPSEEYDAPLGISTGAGMIFGATGGVTEAALRTVVEIVTGKPLENVEFKDVRGMTGLKEAVVPVGDLQVKVAVAHTLANARIILDKIRNGEADYQFIEIMACPGGCIGGGGQPVPVCAEIRERRIGSIYDCDQAYEIRKSHDNPAIQELYSSWLGKPLGEKSHKLLHTHYHPQHKR
jgi:NADH-quinone oxidoreductase subunit G/NADP-reducing hydrogenase subunit HndD